ncbi:MAG: CoA ester lyase [Rhodothermia bacterium]|nr:CoA ester lyase [Rhodothermia bacterium]
MLFMPGTDRNKAEKAAQMDVDTICLDLEDGTALNRKEEARACVKKTLREVAFGDSQVFVRINDLRSPFWQEDLAVFANHLPDGIVIAKTESGTEVEMVASFVQKTERRIGREVGTTKIFAVVESARGLISIREISETVIGYSNVQGLVFGAEDYAGSIAATRTKEGTEVLMARSTVIAYAKAFSLEAIDTIYANYSDLSGLRAETEAIKELGFTGKLAVHPNQVPIIQAVFQPTDQEAGAAKALIEAYEVHQKEGVGVFTWEGKMVDSPNIVQAKNIIRLVNKK